jgi:hypothetical protein
VRPPLAVDRIEFHSRKREASVRALAAIKNSSGALFVGMGYGGRDTAK